MDNNVEVGKDSQEDEDGRRGNLWDYQVEQGSLKVPKMEFFYKAHI